MWVLHGPPSLDHRTPGTSPSLFARAFSAEAQTAKGCRCIIVVVEVFNDVRAYHAPNNPPLSRPRLRRCTCRTCVSSSADRRGIRLRASKSQPRPSRLRPLRLTPSAVLMHQITVCPPPSSIVLQDINVAPTKRDRGPSAPLDCPKTLRSLPHRPSVAQLHHVYGVPNRYLWNQSPAKPNKSRREEM